MKYLNLKILSFLLFLSGVCIAQTSVPNTDTFSLQDVYNAVHAHTSGTTGDLQSCFTNAISSYFDPTYNTDSYAPVNSMLRFRNYHPTSTNPCDYPISSFGTSSSGACLTYDISSYYTAKQAIALDIYWNSGIAVYDPNCTTSGGGAFGVRATARTVGQTIYSTSSPCNLYSFTGWTMGFENGDTGSNSSGGWSSGYTGYIYYFQSGIIQSKESFNQTWPSGFNYSSYSNLTQMSVTINCSVSSDGGNSITERGVCYSLLNDPVPTISSPRVSSGSGTGNFSCNLSGLTANTAYHFRIYAKNEWGTSYSNTYNFSTNP